MRNVKKGTGSVRMCDKGSQGGNRFLDKEHERKEEKTNVRRERKECEREIINLHYRNQTKCHGIDRRAREWCIAWSIFLTTNTRTNYCKNPPSIARTDRWEQHYTAQEHNSPHKQTHSSSVTRVKCLHCAFLQMTQAVTFRSLVNEFTFSSGGGGCVWHGAGDQARGLSSTG